MCTSLLDPKMDFIFKSIFGNEKEKSVLVSFLNAAIKSDSPIVDVEMRNVEITKEAIADKNSRLDVKAVANDGTIINVEIHFLELPKLKGFSVEDPLSGWGMFLKEPSSDVVEEAEETVKEIKLAKKKLYLISSDEDERERYRMREKGKLDEISALATAEEKGRAEGENLAKINIAKGLIGLISDELIAEKTGLSVEEIKKLK